jgi:CHAD domain-containing protein
MAPGKWISDLKATMPITTAARRVLGVRLGVVRDYLPLAVHEPDKDPEHVHQLRVGTRRAGAALDIFSLCLSPKVWKAARKQLRRLRRAAAEARDWDVFLIGLSEWQKQQPASHRPGLDFLIGHGDARRQVAQAHLEEAVTGHSLDIDRFVAQTVRAVRKPQDAAVRRLIDLARPWLANLIRELDQAASGNLDDYEHLHQVRIIGKRLRYAMEVFADCFAPAFREEIYPAVEEMQEILGNANDSHVAGGRLEALRARLEALRPEHWKRYRIGFEGLQEYHRERLPRERQRFLEWWARWRASGTEAALTALLVSPGNAAAGTA